MFLNDRWKGTNMAIRDLLSLYLLNLLYDALDRRCGVYTIHRRVIHQNSDGSTAAVRRQYGGSTAAVLRQYGGSTAAVKPH